MKALLLLPALIACKPDPAPLSLWEYLLEHTWEGPQWSCDDAPGADTGVLSDPELWVTGHEDSFSEYDLDYVPYHPLGLRIIATEDEWPTRQQVDSSQDSEFTVTIERSDVACTRAFGCRST